MENDKLKEVKLEEEPKTEAAEKGNTKTVQDMYDSIDAVVTTFAQEFMAMLPRHPQVAINNVVIINQILGVKESAKFLVNNYVAAVENDKEQAKKKEVK